MRGSVAKPVINGADRLDGTRPTPLKVRVERWAAAFEVVTISWFA
jgi:hypothetical protein